MAIDYAPYQDWLMHVGQGAIEGQPYDDGTNIGLQPSPANSPDYQWSDQDFEKLFGTDTYGRQGANINPYGSSSGRDALRSLASKLGLSQEQADTVALDYAANSWRNTGYAWSEASNPNLLADDIAVRLFQKAGIPDAYKGASREQQDAWINSAAEHQQRLKDYQGADWGRDPLGSIVATGSNSLSNNWDYAFHNPGELSLQHEMGGLAGMTPAGTRLNNTLNDRLGGGIGGGSNSNFKEQFDQWGDPNTKENQADAMTQGYDPSGLAQWTQLARMMFGGSAVGAGTGAASNAVGGGLTAAGTTADTAATVAPMLTGAAMGVGQAYGGGANASDTWLKGIAGGLSGISSSGPTASDANGNMDTSGFSGVDWGTNNMADNGGSFDTGQVDTSSWYPSTAQDNSSFDPEGFAQIYNMGQGNLSDASLFGVDAQNWWTRFQGNNPFPTNNSETGGGATTGGGAGDMSLPKGLNWGDIFKGGGNAFLNLYMANRARQDAQAAADRANALNDPRRAGAQGMTNELINNPQSYLENNPFAKAVAAKYRDNIIPNQVAKSGNPGMVIDKAGSQFVNELSGNYNSLLQQLSGIGGYTQGAGFAGNVYGQGNMASYPFMQAGLGGTAPMVQKVFGDPMQPNSNTMKTTG